MKFDYQDHGAVASLTITATLFEKRKYDRVVDTTLFRTSASARHSGFFLMKTVISGRTPVVMRAYKLAIEEFIR